ncbi:MAG: hypothetical protein AAF488_09500 [Planctomycetota bacterium]
MTSDIRSRLSRGRQSVTACRPGKPEGSRSFAPRHRHRWGGRASRFWASGILALLFVMIAISTSCVAPSRRVAERPRIEIDPGGVLRVGLGRSSRRIRTVATTRSVVPLEPELSGAHVFVIRPGQTQWRRVVTTADHGGPVLDVAAEGEYRLLASDVQTHGLLPSLGDIEALRLVVDRSSPRLTLGAQREGGAWVVDYNIEDELSLSEPASLLISEDGGRRWRRVYRALGRNGRVDWRFPTDLADQVHLSLTATDLVGNGSTLQRPLRRVIAGPVSVGGHASGGGLARRHEAAGDAVANGGTVDGDPRAVDANANGVAIPRPAVGTANAADPVNSSHGSDSGTQSHDASGTDESTAPTVASSEILTAPDDATPAAPTRPRPTAAAVWRDLHARELLVPGGGVLAMGPGLEAAELIHPDGVVEAVELVEGQSVRLPDRDGAGYRLTVRMFGHKFESVGFRIDSTAPRVAVIRVEARPGGIFVEYLVEDAALRYVRLSSRIRRNGGEWREVDLPVPAGATADAETLLVTATTQHVIPAEPGTYDLYLVGRDLGGRRVETPSGDDPLQVRVAGNGPRLAVAQGAVYRGGERHTLYLERIDPEWVRGKIRIDALPLSEPGEVADGSVEPVAIGEVDASTTSRSWRVPRRDGAYQFRLRWNDQEGRACEWISPTTFEIDATPPRLEWIATRSNADEMRAEVRTLDEGVTDWELWRRPLRSGEMAPDRGWARIPVDQVTWTGVSVVTGLVATDDWAEGPWQLGVRARDVVGNVHAYPVPSEPFEVDRTPPTVDGWPIPSTWIEGVPWSVSVASGEVPAELTLRWEPRTGAPVEFEVVPETIGGTARIDVPLPPGDGQLVVIAEDESGNRSNRSARVTVFDAVESLTVDPRGAVAPGESVSVNYVLRNPHPSAERPLALRLLAKETGQVVLETPLEARTGRRSFSAPVVTGTYEITIGVAKAEHSFRRGVDLQVARPRTGPTPPLTDVLLADFRNFRSRWLAGERGADVIAERDRLQQSIGARVQAKPRDVAYRRAWVALMLHRDPPELDRARQILDDGVKQPLSDPDLALLFDDRAVVESLAGNFDEARRKLSHALDLDRTSARLGNLGRVYLNLGRPLYAVRQYVEAMRLDPPSWIREDWIRALSRLEPGARELELRDALRTVESWRAGGVISEAEASKLTRLARSFLPTP